MEVLAGGGAIDSPESEVLSGRRPGVSASRPAWIGPAGRRSRRRSTARLWSCGLLVAADGAGVTLALVLADAHGWAGWLYAGTVLAVGGVLGDYRPRITLRALDQVPAAARRAGTALLPVLTIAVFLAPSDDWALTDFVLQVPLTALCVACTQMLVSVLLRRLRRHGYLSERVVIVGAGRVGSDLATLLAAHPDSGLVPVGFVDEPLDASTALPLGLPRLCAVSQLGGLIATMDLDRVIVAFPRVRDHVWVGVLRAAAANGIEVDIVPRFFDVGLETVADTVDEVWGIPLYRMPGPAYLAPSWRTKRMMDIAVSALTLLVLGPLLPLIGLAVRLSSSGPALYRQRRIGRDGRAFDLLKFRTMRQSHDGEGTWSASDHPDLTRFGRWLRSTSLDELPQLWNILRGDMSLVGPRPERPNFAHQFERDVPGYRERQRLPSGLTGWAQVHGLRGDTSIAERARFDNYYIEHWSLWLDVCILLRTAGVVLRSLFGTSVLPDRPAHRQGSTRPWVAVAGTATAAVEQGEAP